MNSDNSLPPPRPDRQKFLGKHDRWKYQKSGFPEGEMGDTRVERKRPRGINPRENQQ